MHAFNQSRPSSIDDHLSVRHHSIGKMSSSAANVDVEDDVRIQEAKIVNEEYKVCSSPVDASSALTFPKRSGRRTQSFSMIQS